MGILFTDMNRKPRRIVAVTEGQARSLGMVTEVRYLDATLKNKKDPHDAMYRQAPLRNDETVRVYHGCGDIGDAVLMARYGTSGMSRHPRRYSYENGMNPHGLFVTVKPDKAFDFASGHKRRVVIEFSAKVTQLDYPVWNGQGTYFGQGSNPQPFNGKAERDIQKQGYQDYVRDDRDTPETVRLSDNPRLAYSLLCNNEFQALFVGNLDPNQIKRFWVKENGAERWVPYTRREFLKRYGDAEIHDYIEREHNHPAQRLFRPNEDFTSLEDMAARAAGGDEEWIPQYLEELRRWADKESYANGRGYYAPELAQLLWPKQLIQLMGMDWFREYCSPFYDDPTYSQYDGEERPRRKPEWEKVLAFAKQRFNDGFTIRLGKNGATQGEKEWAQKELPMVIKCMKEIQRLYKESGGDFTFEDAKQYYLGNKNTEYRSLGVEIMQYLADGYTLMDVHSTFSDECKKLNQTIKWSTERCIKSLSMDDENITVTTHDAVINDWGCVEEYKNEATQTFKTGSVAARKFVKALMKDENFRRAYRLENY